MKPHCFVLSVILGLVVSFSLQTGIAQPLTWRHLGTVGDNISCGYFWSTTLGVVGGDEMFYTTDGTTWRQSKTPHYIPYVLSIRCFDGNTLYAQTSWDELWKSVDHGATWTIDAVNDPSLKGASDVYWDYNTQAPVVLPPGDGATVARMDRTHLIAAPDDRPVAPHFSTDGGATWHLAAFNNPPDPSYMGGWGAYADTVNQIFYATSEYGALHIMRSTDLGRTWDFLSTVPSDYSVDDLEGADGKLYYHGQSGVESSTDGGGTWNKLGGPGRLYDDEHFLLFACQPVAIVVFDDSGGIWIANEASASISPVRLTLPTPDVGCAALTASIALTNPNCQPLLLTRVTWPADLTPLPFDSLIYTNDTIRFGCTPHPTDTTIVAQFHLQGHYLPSGDLFDSVIFVTIQYHASTSLLSSSSTFNLGSGGPCKTFDTILVLNNLGCDTLRVGLSQSALPAGWSVVPASGTVMLPPGETDTVHVQYSGHIPGSYSLTLSYPYTGLRSGQVSANFNLSVSSASNVIGLFETSVDLGDRSLCVDTVLHLTVTNTGCDSMMLTGVRVKGNGTFKLINPSDSLLPPNGVIVRQLLFHARGHGVQRDTLVETFTHPDGSPGGDTTIPFYVNVVRGATALQSSVNIVDVGETYICSNERDTFVVFQNPSCDTVCISAMAIVPGTFVLAAGQTTNRCLPPGQSDTVRLESRIDTAGQPASNTATLTITSDADKPLTPITLTREIMYPISWHLTLDRPVDSSHAGDSVVIHIVQSGPLPPDVTAIDVVLIFDDDLLRYLGADETSVSSGFYYRASDGMAHQTLHIAPVSSMPTLATLHFSCSLAPHLTSIIRLDSIRMTSSLGRPKDCIASIGPNPNESALFLLRQDCGTTTMSMALRGVPIVFDAIQPNPAHDEVRLSYSSDSSGPIEATIQLEDVLGRSLFETPMTIYSSSKGSISIPLQSLPHGIYSVRIGVGGAVWTRHFIKE